MSGLTYFAKNSSPNASSLSFVCTRDNPVKGTPNRALVPKSKAEKENSE
jgi:hypothetical protein